jgi:hypothetical protein
MKDEEKVKLVRSGNEHFNNGNISEAIKLFVKAGYRDGIMRVADFYFYDKKQPLIAFKFYKMINRKDRIDEIFARMMFALGKWLRAKPEKEKIEEKSSSAEEIEVKIHPKLRILAEEIIRDSKDEKL